MKIIINGESVDISGSSSGVVNWENINGRPDLSNVSSMTVAPIVLNHLLWTDNQQTISIEGILEDEKAQLIIPIPASTSEDLYKTCGIKAVSQSENTLVFEATTTPTEDVSVIIYIIGAAKVKEIFTAEWWSPQMTSATEPAPYVVTTNDENAFSGRYPWQLFAGDDTKAWMQQKYDVDTFYIQIDMGKKKRINGVSFVPYTYSDYMYIPTSFNLEGSNDLTSWMVLTTVTTERVDARQEFKFENKESYRYYRLTHIARYNNWITNAMANMQFYGMKQEVLPNVYS